MNHTTARSLAVLVVGVLASGAFTALPTTAAKGTLTKKKALRLFYTKAESNRRYISEGEATSSLSLISATDRGTATRTTITEQPTTLNSVPISVPTDGTLLISGSVSLESYNVDTTATLFTSLAYRVDSGQFVKGAEQRLDSPGAANINPMQVAFTDSASVPAGHHTVEMRLEWHETASDRAVGYMLNNLSVTFFPNGTIT